LAGIMQIISYRVLNYLREHSREQQRGLAEVYALLPRTRCKRRTLCCSLLPEVSLVEALKVLQRLEQLAPPRRRDICRKIYRYFFMNPLEVTSCPFLEEVECVIYEDRFFGCRSYGLWSQQCYQQQLASDRQAKSLLRHQWHSLGVSLPRQVIDFQLPYCTNVETEGGAVVEDEMLLQTAELVGALSCQLNPWHQVFRNSYFADFSFLCTSLVMGFAEAVQQKLLLVQQVVATGDRSGVARLVNTLPDLWIDEAAIS